MEYIFNWIVLLLTIGAILLVAVVCCSDLSRKYTSVTASPPRESFDLSQTESDTTISSSGRSLQLSYYKDGSVYHVQTIVEGNKGYIGTEAYAGLGAGMLVRNAEIFCYGGAFNCCNLDVDTPLRVITNGNEVVLPKDQATVIQDGSEIILTNGWTIHCSISEAQV